MSSPSTPHLGPQVCPIIVPPFLLTVYSAPPVPRLRPLMQHLPLIFQLAYEDHSGAPTLPSELANDALGLFGDNNGEDSFVLSITPSLGPQTSMAQIEEPSALESTEATLEAPSSPSPVNSAVFSWINSLQEHQQPLVEEGVYQLHTPSHHQHRRKGSPK
ncbi:hypothetical protein Pelo_13566 [Pelomyxa schiedti]|nr:hypothetical protein Pelo_13566 [Pelomyxa schiedti]